MMLKNRGVCNVANVCWQRVPESRQTDQPLFLLTSDVYSNRVFVYA